MELKQAFREGRRDACFIGGRFSFGIFGGLGILRQRVEHQQRILLLCRCQHSVIAKQGNGAREAMMQLVNADLAK